MRIALDATSLLGPRTGVGVVTAELLSRLAAEPDIDVRAFGITWRGRRELAQVLPDGVTAVGRPMAARPLREAWARWDQPPIEWWTGPVDVVHGPNYVVPPTRRAGGARVGARPDLRPPSRALHARHAGLPRAHPAGAGPRARRCTPDPTSSPTRSRRVRGRPRPRSSSSRTARPTCRPTIPTPTRPPGGRWPVTRATSSPSAPSSPARTSPRSCAAFDALAGDRPDLGLVIAGQDGWGADALDAAVVSASPHRARIRRLGWVDDRRRAALLRGAAVYAYPSVYEGFGLPPLEAMAAGTPVVTTTRGIAPRGRGRRRARHRPRRRRRAGRAPSPRCSTTRHRPIGSATWVTRALGSSRGTATAAGLVDTYRRLADLHSVP